MTRPRAHKFSRREIASLVCNDCNTNVLRDGSYFMLSPKIWRDKFGLGWDDNLCLACIETRLGRRVSIARGDFCSPPPAIEGFPRSDALLERFGFKREKPRKKKTARKKVMREKAQ
jgi:hypothetical protein